MMISVFKIPSKIIAITAFFYLPAALILCALAYAQPGGDMPGAVGVKAQVDKDTAGIGDGVKYTITVSGPKGIEIDFPSLGNKIGELSVRNSGFLKKGFLNNIRSVYWYELCTYETGDFTIPRIRLKYRQKPALDWEEIETQEIRITVKSALADSPRAQDIRDIKPPVGFKSRIIYFLIIAALFFVVMAVFFGLKGWKERAAARIHRRSAWEIAYERLEALTKKGLAAKGMINEYYIELSDIVRRYLEDRFSLRAPEMTTEEFLATIRDSGNLSYEHKSLLRDFLSGCDLVKFAKYGPTDQEAASSFDSAKRLIDQTRPQEEKREAGQA